MAQKQFKDLNLKDAFLFAAALEDAETCRMILEIILERRLSEVRVHVEHSLLYSSEFRSIRLDVYASDETEVGYNVEMQNGNKSQLPKRSRFHQAELDIASLKPGEDFRELKPSYVIFICTFDPFTYGLYRYTFEERCLERDFRLGDGTCKIFLSTKGNNKEEVPEELVNFLHYVEDSTDACVKESKDIRLEELHKRIRQLKSSRKWEEQYMTFGELIDEHEREAERRGRTQGIAQGEERLLELIGRMAEAGDVEMIPKLKGNDALLEEMYIRYHL